MSKEIKISPITRISGLMEIEVNINNHKITDAKCSGLLFRGFEKMLEGRDPLDAIYFTERICGICSAAHSLVSARALETCYKINPDNNGIALRNVIHAFEILQNHLRHFYLYTIPDFAVTPFIYPVYSNGNSDLRLPYKINNRISDNYIKAVELSKMSHAGLSVLGGKAPHNHGIFVGGVTESMDASRLEQLRSIAIKLKQFADNEMTEDVYTIAHYYSDYFKMGKGYGNLLSYGLFNDNNECMKPYVNPSVLINGEIQILNENEITENIFNSYYAGKNLENNLYNSDTVADLDKSNAYSFVKAPRYKGLPMEGGPLARMILSKNYRNKVSMMDRTIARVLETRKICDIILRLLECVSFENEQRIIPDAPREAQGYAMSDTSRGALAHFISIRNKKIDKYNIITPSAWNCSPKDSNGVLGVIEKALIGTEIQNDKNAVEIGRIVRSYDPCISCATHVFCDNFEPLEIII